MSDDDKTPVAIQRRLAPAETGPVGLRVEIREEAGATVALIHVTGAYDCKGTEAEIAGLMRGAGIGWRIAWH